MRLIALLIVVLAGFQIGSAAAQNTTPRGYIKPVIKNIGNNPEFAQKPLVQNGQNFRPQEGKKMTKKRDRKDRRARAQRQAQKPTITGVNE